MRIAFLGAPNSWYFADLKRAAGNTHEINALPFSRISTSLNLDALKDTTATTDWQEFDCVLIRTMPPGTLEQVVFRMDAIGQWEAAGRLVLNPARAIEVAVDKYLCLARMRQAGLNVPGTHVCQNVDQAMEAFADMGGDIVLKPLFGSEGRGITRITDEAVAWRSFKTLEQIGAVIYIQEYLEHQGFDWRLFVVGDRVLGMKRHNRLDWRTNVSRGASCQALRVSDELADIALRATQSVGAEIAGVDFLPALDGKLYALEVNAVPGWRALAKTLKTDIAGLVLDYIHEKSVAFKPPYDPAKNRQDARHGSF